ncbi:MAG TPA: hypothetical protein VGB82_16735 [Alphaproteobacteria bacterium]
MSPPVSLITMQFLAWVAERLRSYGEAMEAWRTSCPRLSVWEDATLDGLVRLDIDPDGRTVVRLTPRGRAILDGEALPVARPDRPDAALQNLT